MTDKTLQDLYAGPLFPFADWPNAAVPKFGAGIYAIWNEAGVFIYAGMSGRSITDTSVPSRQPVGLYTRLHSHASGRRSGDQFCVYVADSLVLPTLSADDIQGIATGRHSMDAFVRRHIHGHLGYRFLMMHNGASAFVAERLLRAMAYGGNSRARFSIDRRIFLAVLARKVRLPAVNIEGPSLDTPVH